MTRLTWTRVKWMLAFASMTALAGALEFTPATAQEWKPSKNVDIVVSSGTGGAAGSGAIAIAIGGLERSEP